MTPKDIIKELIRENNLIVDNDDDTTSIRCININLLEETLQRIINRSKDPISRERIARMSFLLQENERVAAEARQTLESLYNKPDENKK